MIYAKIFNILKVLFSLLIHCRILIGADPNKVHGLSIIFFPLLPHQLNCGFAGLMTCRLTKKSSGSRADQTLHDVWKDVKACGLSAMLSPEMKAEHYLNGLENLKTMEAVIADLKQEETQAYLFFQTEQAERLRLINADMKTFLVHEEKILEEQASAIHSADLELINSRLLLLKDVCWILEKDILANLTKILMLTGANDYSAVPPAAFHKYRKLNLLLNALDRLEVRGRDSAGIQLTFVLKKENVLKDIEQKIAEQGLADDYRQRAQKSDLMNRSIAISGRTQNDSGNICVTFTYKTFSIVGELGRNVADLRNIIQHDGILHVFSAAESICETALTHTRWASVGAITEVNCHPVNNHTLVPSASAYPRYPDLDAQINVVLNGDIDNYPALRKELETVSELIAEEVTTDTKIIPLQIEKYLKSGENLTEAFRLALNDFEGSHAIVMTSNLEPGKMFLALKGSGQAIFVGVSEDQFMVASELYGLVEVMPRFIKLNGEAFHHNASGQIFVLDQNAGSGIAGITACFYDGSPVQLTENDLQTAEITTRDIDRSDFPHYFLKEISESALSIKRTLRGKYRIAASGQSSPEVIFNLGADIIPDAVHYGLQDGSIKNVIVIGHGTAAVAGQAVADAFAHYLKGSGLNISSRVASELSGFGLKDDLSDTLVIPITQSGTTTDTNRAVAMAKDRGAKIISIVNRRQSDITAKSHGVFYTSDGRDIEMSVASTKAFYAQIIAGQVLALYFARLLNVINESDTAAALRNLETAPQLMAQIFERRDVIAASVRKTVNKRYWAIVGSGPNKAAADEIRIKLSELCYKTISSDIVENKKHIDLSAEPLILVCAAGNPQAVAEDVVKDAAIFKAHQAAVVVFNDEGDHSFDRIADAVIPIPSAPAPLPVILNTMAGHLWGYFAACAIDEEAQFFREFRNRLSTEMIKKTKQKLSIFEILDMIADISFCRIINDFYADFKSRNQSGAFSILVGKTIADLTLLLKYAAGKLPLQDIRQEFKGDGNLVNPFDLLDAALGTVIDELTRPIDAIRHQAKTVTVGTSRKEREPKGIVFDLLEVLKFSAKNLTYRNISAIHRLQPAVAAVRGYTVYLISGLDEQGHPTKDSTISISVKGGVAANMLSRADHSTTLMGVKRTIISSGHVYLGRGKTDGASIMIIPLQGADANIHHLLLIHITFNETLSAAEKIEALGYRYDDIRNLVNEYNMTWDDHYLNHLSMEFLFSEPIEVIAGQIKSQYGPS